MVEIPVEIVKSANRADEMSAEKSGKENQLTISEQLGLLGPDEAWSETTTSGDTQTQSDVLCMSRENFVLITSFKYFDSASL